MNLYQLEECGVRLCVRENKQGVTVELSDGESGAVWGPSPAFVMEAMSLLLQGTEPVTNAHSEVTAGDGWVEVSSSVESSYVTVGATVRFSLQNGELVVEVPTSKLVEPRGEVSLLDGLEILPGFMNVTGAQPGHLVLPLRQGALCYPERHTRGEDRFLIYGEQRRWELLPLLPCCGAVREARGGAPRAALLAIVEAGDCDAECRVAVDGQGGGETGFALRYRYTPIDPVDPIDRVVRFVPLRGGEASYAGMGRRLHRFVGTRYVRGTLAERAAENPELDYASNAFILKILHGCKKIGPLDGSGEYVLYTTCEEAMQQLALLKEHGIERLWVQLTGWNPGGHDGCWPTRFPVDEAIGGEAGFRELLEFGQSLGYQMQVHDNYLDNYRSSPEFDAEQCIGDIYGGLLKRGCWGGGLMYAGWGLAFPDDRLEPQMQKVHDLGVRGVFYLDDMGLPLEISYNENHGEARYRRACAEGVNRVLRAGRTVFGACSTENGYLYLVPDSDYISSTWLNYPPAPPGEYADEVVPLWLMAVKGFLFSNLNDTFNAVVDRPGQEDCTVAHRMLTMAECGLAPRNETVAVCGDWCYPVEETVEAMKLEYDLMLEPLRGTIQAALVDHEVLSGAGTDARVVRSRFADGTTVLCDYANLRLEIDGEPYELPTDFVKRAPLKWGERSPRFANARIEVAACA